MNEPRAPAFSRDCLHRSRRPKPCVGAGGWRESLQRLRSGMAPLGSRPEGVSPSMESGRGLYMSVTCAKAQRLRVSHHQ